eukprot:SAG31_NODE_1385_length_8573_cov_27.673118_3_plen_147_part_00
MWGYGNPTAKAILVVDGVRITTDATWTAGISPVLMNSEYNGVTYDARNETAGWDTTACAGCSGWPAALADGAPKLSNTTLSSASFAPIEVMHTFTAKWMREPSPGVYVFDFTQVLLPSNPLRCISCRQLSLTFATLSRRTWLAGVD